MDIKTTYASTLWMKWNVLLLYEHKFQKHEWSILKTHWTVNEPWFSWVCKFSAYQLCLSLVAAILSMILLNVLQRFLFELSSRDFKQEHYFLVENESGLFWTIHIVQRINKFTGSPSRKNAEHRLPVNSDDHLYAHQVGDRRRTRTIYKRSLAVAGMAFVRRSSILIFA